MQLALSIPLVKRLACLFNVESPLSCFLAVQARERRGSELGHLSEEQRHHCGRQLLSTTVPNRQANCQRGRYLCELTRHEMLALEYNALGVAWKTKGELDRAEDSFSRAITLDSVFSEAFKNRGSTKYHRAAKMPRNEQAQREELRSAIADLQEAVKINNNYAEALYSLGLVYFAMNELDAARDFPSAMTSLRWGA